VEAVIVVESWESFFLGQVGASAALGGLIFVAVSLNLTKILAYRTLPGRALDALLLLLAVLVLSSLMLVPGQPFVMIGLECLVMGLGLWLAMTVRAVRAVRRGDVHDRRHYALNFVLMQIVLLPYIVGGLMMMAGVAAGLYWIAAAILFSFVKAVLEAWVLLIEINR
jgi:hypothetical protein